jgi:hypothetical protein
MTWTSFSCLTEALRRERLTRSAMSDKLTATMGKYRVHNIEKSNIIGQKETCSSPSTGLFINQQCQRRKYPFAQSEQFNTGTSMRLCSELGFNEAPAQ